MGSAVSGAAVNLEDSFMTTNTRRWLLGCVAALVLAAGAPPRAVADMIVLIPTDANRGIDNFPRDGIFDALLGNPGSLTVSLPPPGMGSEERAALEFSLLGIPAGSTITSVTLSLTIGFLSAFPPASEIHGYAGNGVVELPDLMVMNLWTNFNPGPSGMTQLIALPTDYLQTLVDASASHAGLSLRNTQQDMSTVFSFFSNLNLPNRPTLTVEFEGAIPEPSSLTLLACGAVVLAGSVVRRRRALADKGKAL